LAVSLASHIGGGLLRGGDRQIGVSPDQVTLLCGGCAGSLLSRGLGGVGPLHVPNDPQYVLPRSWPPYPPRVGFRHLAQACGRVQ
jgi:hypothetical protein